MKLRIGELAKLAGCKVVTIRYYEKEGLLKAPGRTAGNYRSYGDEDISRLQFILHCRQHGMNLAEIRALLAYNDNPHTNCDWINSLIESHIGQVERQIKALRHLKEHLERLYNKCGGGKKVECGILKSLVAGEKCRECEKMKEKGMDRARAGEVYKIPARGECGGPPE